MDRGLARAALIAIPALAGLFYGLSFSALRPLSAALTGMAVYWGLLAVAIGRRGGWSLKPRWPGWAATIGLAVPTLAALAVGATMLPQLSAHVLALVVLAALLNGTLEEAFWRGALIPHPDIRAAIAATGLFTLWHLAPAIALAEIVPRGHAALLVPAGLGFGAVAIWARMTSGSAGTGAIAHVLTNLGTFSLLAATHGAPSFP